MSGQIQNPVGIQFPPTDLQNYGVEGHVDHTDVEYDIICEPVMLSINEHCRAALREEFMQTNANFGIDDYNKCLEIINRY